MSRNHSQYVLRHVILRSLLCITLLSSLAWSLSSPKIPENAQQVNALDKPDEDSPEAVTEFHAVHPGQFDKVLWYTEPPPPVVPKPVQPPPKQKLTRTPIELIAICTYEQSEGLPGRQTAMLFDPISDQLIEVVEGQQVGRVKVVEVSKDGVALLEHGEIERLFLDGGGAE